VTLQVSLSPAVTNPWGKRVRAVKVEGKLNRLDYGASWNKTLDKGGLLVGNDVKLDIEIELNK
jgi:polyisoprenoid-binding protein YceI